MIFTAPLGLLALLAIPAIVVIHLFRRRFPPRPVAGLFLWQVVQQTPQGGGRVSKLPITASLILECLAALALALILAGARFNPASVNEHLVMLLDDSASMAAINAQNQSPRDRAAQRIVDEVERFGRGVRVTLIESGERPSVLAGPAALGVEARPALEKWKPESQHHSLALGLRLARELAGKTGRIMVFSDAPPELEIEGIQWVSVGEPLGNVGIIGAQRSLTPSEGKGTISLTFGNSSPENSKRQLHLVSAGKEILTQEINVPPRTSSVNLPLPAGLPAVTVALSNDALPRDNEVTLVEPRPQIVSIENRLPEGRGRDALDRALRAVSGITRSDHAQLVFGLANVLDPPPEPGVWRAGFGRAPARLLAPGEPKDLVGPFIPEKRHPLLQGVTLGGVVWAGAVPVNLSVVRPVLSSGNQPLIGLLGPRPDDGILFNVDLDRTNLPRTPDWPILVSNVVELRRQDLPGPERWNYRAGEWVRVRLGRDPKGPLHFRCGAIERDLPPSRLMEFTAPAPCGLLEITEGQDVLFQLGVNFLDEKETNLSDRGRGEFGKPNPLAGGMRTESGPESDPLFWTLLAIAGIALLANWCWAIRGTGAEPARGRA
jgi:von Willebrand factor type A domain/Aerotolerance regulator N-terminal